MMLCDGLFSDFLLIVCLGRCQSWIWFTAQNLTVLSSFLKLIFYHVISLKPADLNLLELLISYLRFAVLGYQQCYHPANEFLHRFFFHSELDWISHIFAFYMQTFNSSQLNRLNHPPAPNQMQDLQLTIRSQKKGSKAQLLFLRDCVTVSSDSWNSGSGYSPASPVS